MIKYHNLLEVILSKKNKTDKGITFIDGIDDEKHVTYSQIYHEATMKLNKMIYFGVKQGDEVILQLTDDLDFITVFWACILGKMIPVPLPTSNTNENNNKINKVVHNLASPVIVADSIRTTELKENLEKDTLPKECTILNIATDIEGSTTCEVDKSSKHSKYAKVNELIKNIEIDNLDYDEEEIAFIQFSSGSTGDPKGVIITHKNIISNMKGMIKSSHIVETDVFLSWVPLTHNLGLIVTHLLAMVCHLDSYIMKTELFLYHPYLWLEKVDEHNATLTCSPNFGYMHYLKSIQQKKPERLDLSSLRMIINGAEPISKEICTLFMKTMENYGLRKNIFQTAYGLAEATVSVTSTIPGEPLHIITIDGLAQNIKDKVIYLNKISDSTFGLELIAVGYTHFNNEIRVVDDENHDLGQDVFGNIQVKGPITAKGYYDANDETEKLYSMDGWLNTGDIGFIKENQLVICGRKKDIIFINGKNYYSNDIEMMLSRYDNTKEYLVIGVSNKDMSKDDIIAFVKEEEVPIEQFAELSLNIKKDILSKSGIKIDYVLPIMGIPRTSSGKVQRYQLIEAYQKGKFNDISKKISLSEENLIQFQQSKLNIETVNEDENTFSRNEVITKIQEIIKEILGFLVDDLNESLVNYGITSMKVAQFNMLLQESFKKEIPASTVFDYPTINALADYILDEKTTDSIQENHWDNNKDSKQNNDIAIVGVGCRFPGGANDVETYQKKLLEGYDAITEIPEDRKYLYQYFQDKNETRYGGFLDHIDRFQPGLYGITPVEAEKMDPGQRILLDVVYDAMQNAVIDIGQTKGSNTGVFVGISGSDYMDIMKEETSLEQIDNYMITGNMISMASGRIGYVFDWHGPMMSIDTACSSSLVAVHEAVTSLLKKECDMAVAGGVNVILSPKGYIGLSKMKALAPDGRCKTFDESANGYVRSEGCGMVVLKRYQDALDHHDNILAVMKATSLNHDGRCSGLTAPNGVQQTKLIQKTIQNAGINIEDIKYIETHGTGTKLGDPQEINALLKAYENRNNQTNKILLGSVKSNIGHTESASGIAGLIKVVLAIKNGIIPKNIHFQTPNKLIDWDNIPFKVNDTNYIWDDKSKPRIAAVSSFGFSGTNAHVILQEPPNDITKTNYSNENNINVFTVSAQSKELLKEDLKNLKEYLSTTSNNLSDICGTLNRSRAYEKYKVGICKNTKESIIQEIDEYLNDLKLIKKPVSKERKIAFLFLGADSFQSSMARELYQSNSAFKEAIDECNTLCQTFLNLPLKELLYEKIEEETQKLEYRYPLILAIEYALVKVLESYKISPGAVMGYDVGEYMAAYMANVITLNDTFLLACEEGRIKDNKANTVFDSDNAAKQYEAILAKVKLKEPSLHFQYAMNQKDADTIELNSWTNRFNERTNTKESIQQLSSYGYDIVVEIKDDLEQAGNIIATLYELGIEIDFNTNKRSKFVNLPNRSKNEKIYWFQ